MGRWARIAVAGALLAAGAVPLHALGTIETGNASFAWLNFGTNGESSAGFADFKIGSIENLRQHWFYYRVEGGPREFPLPIPSAESYESNPGAFELDWNAVGGLFDAKLQASLAAPGPGQARLSESLTITNIGAGKLNVSLFVYADIDVRDEFGGFPDEATLVYPGRIRIDDFGTFDFAEMAGGGVVDHEVLSFPYLRDFQLVDSGPDDLNGEGLPFAPENFTGAFAWHLFLDPGQSVTLPFVMAINTVAVTGPPPHSPSLTTDFVTVNWTGLASILDRDLGQGKTLGSTKWDRANAMTTGPGGTIYCVARFTVITVDPATGEGTFVVHLPIDDVRAIAFSPSNELYAIERENNGTDALYLVNLGTGGATLVGPTDLDGIEGLAFAPDGTLYAWHDGPGSSGLGLVEIDPGTGAAHDPFPAVGELGDIRGLAVTADGKLYGARHELYRIDPATGISTLVGSGGYFDVSGLAPRPDADADGVPDGADTDPFDPTACQDLDQDLCDDCAGGVEDPASDGLDTDADGACNASDPDDDADGVADGADCAPLDASASVETVAATDLGWAAGPKVTLTWAPDVHATVSNVYRGTLAPEFVFDWICLVSDVGGSSTTDAEEPPSGTGFHYLVTGENACGESDAGTDSSGVPHTVTPCP